MGSRTLQPVEYPEGGKNMNIVVRAGMGLLLVAFCVSPIWSQSQTAVLEKMQQQIEQLQKRINQLERHNSQLEERLIQQEQNIVEEVKRIESATVSGETSAKPAVRSKYPIDLYGYLRLDAAYDDSRTDVGNYARWVRPENGNDDDDQFNLTARQSRFGMTMQGPNVSGAKTSGRVEVDFYEGGSENKNRLMMRHAYLQLDWPNEDFQVLAGQTSDVISPLVAPTLNYPVGWWAGDIGYRRPQLRFSKGFDVGENSNLLFQFAAARTIGDDGPFGIGADTGEDAGFPSLQGRTAFSFPLLTDNPTTVGVSGHWGQEEYDYNGTDDNEDLDTWSLNLDLVIPLQDWLAFQGTVWTGENLDAYLGGIAQGILVTSDDAGNLRRTVNAGNFPGQFVNAESIESTGGWAALCLGPFDRWRFNLGSSIDDPENDDLALDSRTRNSSIFGNVLYDFNEAVQLGLEVSYWDTEYADSNDGDNVRIQSAVTYRF